jgi:hypothetical protein
VAASALAYGLPLATLNTKDFKDFKDFKDRLSLIIQAGQLHGVRAMPCTELATKLRVVHELGLRGAGDENRTRTISLGSRAVPPEADLRDR